MLHVNSQLMSSPRVRMQIDECVAAVRLGRLVKCDGFASIPAFRADHHLLANSCMSTHEGANVVGCQLRNAAHNRSILFANFAAFKLAADLLVNLIIFGDQNHSGRITVQSMHDPWSVSARDVTQTIEVELQGGCERPMRVASPRMDNHIGLLIDDDNRIVLMQDIQRNVLGLDV